MSEENFIRSYQWHCRIHDEANQLTDIVLANLLSNLNIGAIYASQISYFAHTDMKIWKPILPTVPKSNPPFKQNFIFDVPEASVPAVEICWLISEAGIKTSAKETE